MLQAKKIRGGGGIQFSGYHPLKEVIKFVVDEATGRHFLSKVQWPGDETDVSWWMWNVSRLLSHNYMICACASRQLLFI